MSQAASRNFQPRLHRSVSLGLAALLTLVTMSSLNLLAQPDASQPELARAAGSAAVAQAAPSAPRG
ncbi:MAG: hypothetical protein KGI90_03070 [Burkholderiales bacterium]|nr:hypothetical protein [Burkholderiales bacterium]MDE2276555.1 hypothetical protein [Burkholderiales bacterium]